MQYNFPKVNSKTEILYYHFKHDTPYQEDSKQGQVGMAFEDFQQLTSFLRTLDVKKILFKALSENDNTKQQIYLGSDFKSLSEIPFSDVTVHPEVKRANFKARLNFFWINDYYNHSRAPHAKLILYPKYPEVRLSGFMAGCATAPKGTMNPIPLGSRGESGKKDGRILILGIAGDKIYSYLALKGSRLSSSILAIIESAEPAGGALFKLPGSDEASNSRAELINRLSTINAMGWIESCRLDAQGKKVSYQAENGGGYTLEAQFEITPNGYSDPDFKGWELKAFSHNKITLMTPEPDSGFYKEHGSIEFIRKYGHVTGENEMYFTGDHKVGGMNKTTNMRLEVRGYDQTRKIIDDVEGGLVLVSEDSTEAAIWSFSFLLKHWSRKHAHACYVKCEKNRLNGLIGYRYLSPVFLGEGTDFTRFLDALVEGVIIYDPGQKLYLRENGTFTSKRRSQFRINFKLLGNLYHSFMAHELNIV
jgi:hypothetical protein